MHTCILLLYTCMTVHEKHLIICHCFYSQLVYTCMHEVMNDLSNQLKFRLDAKLSSGQSETEDS